MINNTLAAKLRGGQITSYLLLALIIVQLVYWNLTRTSGFTLAVLLVQAMPLLALLPGMLKPTYRSYSWLCFILLFYFIFAVERAFSSIGDAGDVLFLSLIVLLFLSAMMTSRWLQRVQKGVEDN